MKEKSERRPARNAAANPIACPEDSSAGGDLPRVVVVLPVEGSIAASIRGCKGDTALALHVLALLELDEDAADLIAAARRLLDRQAA